MINIFKKLRLDSISKQNVKKYFFYAIGEIFLVTIGVLLAIKANNLNEQKKTKQETNIIYERVIFDIDRNIFEAKKLIEEFKEYEYMYTIILNDSLNKSKLAEGAAYMITGFEEYKFDDTGITQLKLIKTQSKKFIELSKIYENTGINLKSYKVAIEKNITDNLTFWRDNYEWFASYTMNKIEKEAQDYFINNKDYKNRVAYFYLLVYNGYIPRIQEFINDLENWKKQYS